MGIYVKCRKKERKQASRGKKEMTVRSFHQGHLNGLAKNTKLKGKRNVTVCLYLHSAQNRQLGDFK